MAALSGYERETVGRQEPGFDKNVFRGGSLLEEDHFPGVCVDRCDAVNRSRSSAFFLTHIHSFYDNGLNDLGDLQKKREPSESHKTAVGDERKAADSLGNLKRVSENGKSCEVKGDNFLQFLKRNGYRLYCSRATAAWLRRCRAGIAPAEFDRCVKILEPGKPHSITVPQVSSNRVSKISLPGFDYEVTVTAIASNHCQGALMFLFERNFTLPQKHVRRILFTGAMRFDGPWMKKLEDTASIEHQHFHTESGEVKQLDSLYLDSAYCHPNGENFPSREKSVNSVVETVQKHLKQNSKILLSFRSRYSGGEDIITEIRKQIKKKVQVAPHIYHIFKSYPGMKDCLAEHSASIHVNYFNDNDTLEEVEYVLECLNGSKKESLLNSKEARIVVIRPTTMWFVHNEHKPSDQLIAPIDSEEILPYENRSEKPETHQGWRVWFAEHSSNSELRAIVRYLLPSRVRLLGLPGGVSVAMAKRLIMGAESVSPPGQKPFTFRDWALAVKKPEERPRQETLTDLQSGRACWYSLRWVEFFNQKVSEIHKTKPDDSNLNASTPKPRPTVLKTTPRSPEATRRCEADGLLDELCAAIEEKLSDSVANITVMCLAVLHSDSFRRLKLPPIKDSKSSELAANMAKKADSELKKGKFLSAVKLYSTSLRFCPRAAPEEQRAGPSGASLMSVLFWKRAQAFYELRKYRRCILDIMQSCRFQFHPTNEFELFERMGECCEMLHEFNKARRSYEQALALFTKSDGAVSSRLNNRLKKLDERSVTKTALPDFSSDYSPPLWKKIPDVSYGAHRRDSDVSSAVSQTADGRFVASRPINPGDVLFVEKPYAHVITEQNACDNCLQTTVCPTPCSGCLVANYCSQRCQSEAWEQCQLGTPMQQFVRRFSALWLLVRMILRFLSYAVSTKRVESHGSKAILQFLQNMDLAKLLGTLEDSRFDCPEKCHEAVLACLYAGVIGRALTHLTLFRDFNPGKNIWNTSDRSTSNSNTTSDFTSDDVIKRTIFVEIARQFLPTTKEILSCGSVRETNNSCGQANQVTEKQPTFGGYRSGAAELDTDSDLDTKKNQGPRLSDNTAVPNPSASPSGISVSGLGFYPKVSTIKHSCFPNVADVYYGTTCVVRALRSIHKGEEILLNQSGSNFTMTDFATRRALRCKFLDCNCKACQAEKSALSNFVEEPYFRCPHCVNGVKFGAKKCPPCGTEISQQMATFCDKWRLLLNSCDQWVNQSTDINKEYRAVIALVSEIDVSVIDAHLCRPYVHVMEQLHGYFQRMVTVGEGAQEPESGTETTPRKQGDSEFVNSFFNISYGHKPRRNV